MDEVYKDATSALQDLLMDRPELLSDSRKLKNMVADYIHDEDIRDALGLLIDVGFVQKLQTTDSKTKIIKTAEKSIKEVKKKSCCPLDSIYMSANFLYKVVKIEKDDIVTLPATVKSATAALPIHKKWSMLASGFWKYCESLSYWTIAFITLCLVAIFVCIGIYRGHKAQTEMLVETQQEIKRKENVVASKQEPNNEMTTAEAYQQGKAALEAKNYSEALDKFTQAAEAGNAEAMNSLGDMYRKANGVDLDYDTAVDWYRKASDLGNLEATKNLGRMYRTGHGVEKNYAKALELFKKAEAGGNAAAMREIGYLYQFGYGVPKDYDKAMDWYSKAAKAGDAGAYERIGVMYQFGRGVAKDYDKAVSYYQKADSNGSSKGTRRLGYMYESGKGVQQDYTKAMEFYQKAADQGNSVAMNNIGCLYSEGAGVAKDESEAAVWFRKAAEKGDDSGMRNLGYRYLKGIGLSQDYTQALYWIEKSAKEGCVDAMNDLGYMYDHGYGVDYNRSEAIRWFRKAASEGHEEAKENLRKMGETPHTEEQYPTETQKQQPKSGKVNRDAKPDNKVPVVKNNDAQRNVQEEARRRREENLRRVRQNNSENETGNKPQKGGYMSEFKFGDNGYVSLPYGVVAMSGTLTGIKSSCEGLRDIPSPKGKIVYRTTGNERNVMITHSYEPSNPHPYPYTGRWCRVWVSGSGNKTYVGWVHIRDVDQ